MNSPAPGLDALGRAFLVDQPAFQHVGLLDVDVLMVRQHRARRKAHQRGHQPGLGIGHQRLDLAAGKSRRLPFDLGRLDDVRMLARRFGFELRGTDAHEISSQVWPTASVARPSASKNLLGTCMIASVTPPFGDQAECRLPGSRQTNSPFLTSMPAAGPSGRPDGLPARRSARCRRARDPAATAPGANLNSEVDQAGLAVGQQRLDLAAGKARRLPFHLGGLDQMRMLVRGDLAVAFGVMASMACPPSSALGTLNPPRHDSGLRPRSASAGPGPSWPV